MTAEYTEDQFIQDEKYITQLHQKITECQNRCTEYEKVLSSFRTKKSDFKAEITAILAIINDLEANGESFFTNSYTAKINILPEMFNQIVAQQAWLAASKPAYEELKGTLESYQQVFYEENTAFIAKVVKKWPDRLILPSPISPNQLIIPL